MIYGKVTALLKLLQLQLLFTWSGLHLHAQNASGNPFGSEKPPMTTYLNQKETGRSAVDSLLPILRRETLLSTSHSEQMISSLPLSSQLLKNV